MKVSHSNLNLPLPPFGRILEAYLNENVKLIAPIYIYVGHKAKEIACAQKRMGTMCTYLPQGEDHKRYHWPIKDQKIVIDDTGFSSAIALKRMCFDLLVYLPQVIFLNSDTFQPQLYLPKGGQFNGLYG